MTSFSCSAIPGDTLEFNPMSPGHPPPVTSDRLFCFLRVTVRKMSRGHFNSKEMFKSAKKSLGRRWKF